MACVTSNCKDCGEVMRYRAKSCKWCGSDEIDIDWDEWQDHNPEEDYGKEY